MFFFHLPKKKQSGVCGWFEDRRGQEVNQGKANQGNNKKRKLTIVLCKEQAGAELGQGQLKLKLGFISIKI